MAFEEHGSGAVDEKWLPIPGFEGYYEVSDQGGVRSVDRTVTRTNHSAMNLRGKILALQVRKNTGYLVAALSKDGKPRDWYVHRLVLMAFRGLPKSGQEACHGNDIRTDNRLSNLRWDSHTENVKDAVKRGRHRSSSKVQCKRGHALTFDEKQNRKICHPCRRLRERQRYWRNKATPRKLPHT